MLQAALYQNAEATGSTVPWPGNVIRPGQPLQGGAPFMHRGVPAPRPVTGVPTVDALMSMAAPAIGQYALGMTNPVNLPHLAPGVSPSSGFYARDVTQPMVTASQDQKRYQIGLGAGEQLGRIGSNLGVHRALGVSAEEFQHGMGNLGAMGGGRDLAAQALSTPMMQQVMGGDVMGAHDTILRNRHALGRVPGELLAPMDIEGQTGLMEHASKFSTELTKAIRGGEDGLLTTTPNYDFSRGFRDEELSELGATMAQRGVSQMQGVDSDISGKVDAVGETAKSMRAVSELIGGGEMDELISALDKISNKQWPAMLSSGNASGLRQSIQEISSAAKVFGVTGEEMTNAVASFTGERGVGEGVYGDMAAGQMMASHVYAVARTNPNKPISQVAGEQRQLMENAMDSEQGRDIRLLNYAHSQGLITDNAMDDVMGSIATGTKIQQESVATHALKAAFGSEATVDRMTRDDAFMRWADQNTDGSTRGMDMMMAATGREFGERFQQNILDNVGKGSSEYRTQNDVRASLTTKQKAETKMAATLEYFEGDADTVGLLEAAHADAMAEGGPHPEAEALRRVNKVLSGAQYKEQRGEVLRQQRNAVKQKEGENIASGSFESFTDAQDVIKGLTAGAGNFMDVDQSDAVRGLLNASEAAAREGDQVEAEKQADAAVAMAMGHAKAAKVDPRIIKNAVKEQELNAERRLETADAQADKLILYERTGRGLDAMGVAPEVGAEFIEREQNTLAQILGGLSEGVEDGELKEAREYIQQTTTLSDDERKQMIALVNSGDSDELQKAAEQQSRIAGQANINIGQTQVAFGTNASAVEDLKASQGTYGDAQTMIRSQAALEMVVDDANQDLRTTFPQLLIGAAEGTVTLERLLGLQDTDADDSALTLSPEEAKRKQKVVKGRYGKRVAKDLASLGEAQRTVMESGKGVTKAAFSEEVREAGLTKAVLAGAGAMGAAVGDEEKADAAREALVAKLTNAGLDETAIENVMSAVDTGQADLMDLNKAATTAADSSDKFTKQRKNEIVRVKLDEKKAARRKGQAQENAATAIAAASGGKGDMLFAADIDVDDYDMVSDSMWESPASLWSSHKAGKQLRKDIATLSTTDMGLVHTDAEENAALAEIASLSPEELKKTIGGSTEKAEAAERIAKLYSSQEEDGKRAEAKKRGDGGDGGLQELKLSGELIIKSDSGNVIGVTDAAHLSATIGG